MTSTSSIVRPGLGAVLLAPAIVFMTVFLILPFLWVFAISFTNQTLLGATADNYEFVGLSNYVRLFDFATFMEPGNFGNAFVITCAFVLASVIGQAGIGFSVALMFLGRKGIVKSIIFTLITLVWILPDVAVAFSWKSLLDYDDGLLNAAAAGLGFSPIDWQIDHPLLSICVFNIWRGTAFSLLLFSAALESLPPSYFENAKVLGASRWAIFFDITLPLVRRHLLSSTLLTTLWTFTLFSPYLITGGGPAFKSEVLSILTYRLAFKEFDFGAGGAIALLIMLLNFVLVTIHLRIQRKEH